MLRDADEWKNDYTIFTAVQFKSDLFSPFTLLGWTKNGLNRKMISIEYTNISFF